MSILHIAEVVAAVLSASASGRLIVHRRKVWAWLRWRWRRPAPPTSLRGWDTYPARLARWRELRP